MSETCRYAGHNVCDGIATHEIRWPDGVVYYVCDVSANSARLRCHTAKIVPIAVAPDATTLISSRA